jgi:hypothetical protein
MYNHENNSTDPDEFMHFKVQAGQSQESGQNQKGRGNLAG